MKAEWRKYEGGASWLDIYPDDRLHIDIKKAYTLPLVVTLYVTDAEELRPLYEAVREALISQVMDPVVQPPSSPTPRCPSAICGGGRT